MDVGFWSNAGIAFPVTITLAAIALAAGLVFEDIGSRVETYWADAWLKRRCPRFSRGWREYLAQRRDETLIAQGYLRAILLRFKFELSMIPALVSSCIGVIIAELDGNGLGIGQTFILALVMFGLAAMLLDEVRKGSVVLTRTRRIILRGAKGG